jgi:hypothetical protein
VEQDIGVMAMRRTAWVVAAAALVSALVSAGAGPAAAALPGGAADHLCADQTGRFEQAYGIPPQLLDAISKVESGRWDDVRRATVAWPWTVTAEGNGKYFPSKAEAIAEVRRLKAAGVHNIDVGCMQVNLQYHPDAFASLDEAFDPPSNIAYAARFLKGLYGATNHWPTAAAYYHSQTPSLAAAYRERLMKVWQGHGGEGRTEMASLAPIPHQPPLKPRPSLSPRVEEMRNAYRAREAAMHDDARRIADAYRLARLAEYQLRRGQMMDRRRAAGLSADGY